MKRGKENKKIVSNLLTEILLNYSMVTDITDVVGIFLLSM